MSLSPSSSKDEILRVAVLTPLGEGGQGGIDRLMDGLRAHKHAACDVSITFITTRGYGRFRTLLFTPLALARFFISCAAGQFDLVHINLSANGSVYRKFLFSLICRIFCIPYVIHLHGSDFHIFWPRQADLVRRLIDNFFANASLIILLGNIWRSRVIQQLPLVSDKIVLLFNASESVDPVERMPDSDRHVKILFLGQLGPRKGSRDLVSALRTLGTDIVWTAMLAGDGEVSFTRDLVERSGLTARVDVPGWVGPDTVRALLGAADILVLPSYEENLPMSVIEGFAAGLAVVTTPVGATPDILEHKVEGLLVAPGDVEALAAALRSLIIDPALREKLGHAAKKRHKADLDMATYGSVFCQRCREPGF